MRLFDVGAREGGQEVHDRILTLPNAITAVRLAGLPVFVWLVLGPGHVGAALALLVVVAATDWVDGYVARRFDQVSRIGVMLDPLVDRLLLGAAAVTLLLAGILPVAIVVAVLIRDALVVAGSLLLFRGFPPIAVTRTGKTATALLYAGVPLYMLAELADGDIIRPLALIVSVGGIAAYYASGVQYGRAALSLWRQRRGGIV